MVGNEYGMTAMVVKEAARFRLCELFPKDGVPRTLLIEKKSTKLDLFAKDCSAKKAEQNKAVIVCKP
eukprot:6151001-Lingulodinium_polyedra.AAC.1